MGGQVDRKKSRKKERKIDRQILNDSQEESGDRKLC